MVGGPAAGGRPRRLDLAGLLVASPAVLLVVLLVVLPLVLGREAGWPAWSFGCIAAGLLLAAVLVRLERRVAARGGDPLLNLDVLRAPGLPSGLAGWLAVLSAAALPAALIMVRGVSRRSASS